MIQRNSDDALSKLVLDEVGRRLNKQQFLTWFQRVRFAYAGPDRVSIIVPNRFHMTYLKHRYLQNIADAVESVTDLGRPRLGFRVDRDAKDGPVSSDAPDGTSSDRSPRNSRQPVRNAYIMPEVIPLNRDYTFDEFVTGPANRLAYAAATSVAESPGTAYNPLFIYGPVGLGKTHLMQAVAHTYKASGMQRIVYLSCASFTNDYIAALGKNDIDRFREKYREADALLIDDIQFLANKERTQEEFFHTFNAIYNQQKQIFLSSDSLPSEIAGLGERLVSRFKLGLVAQLSPPSFETRVAILVRKGKNLNLEIDPEVAEYVAQRLKDNVRELEGAVLRIHSMAMIERRPITINSVKNALADILTNTGSPVDLTRIQNLVVEHYSVKPSDLHSKKRNRSIVLPRQICMYLARRHTNMSLEEIGRFFGGRDHTTVLHSVDKVDQKLSSDARLRSTIESIEQQLNV